MTVLEAVLAPPPPVENLDQLILPRNLDAETSTLAAAMLEQSAADYLVDNLTAADYFRRSHQTIFLAVRELRARGVTVDLITVKQELGARLEEVGGPLYLAQLCDGVPRGVNVPHYAAILKDLRVRRELMAYARRTLEAVASGEHHSTALLADADRRLLELARGTFTSRMQSLKESMPEFVRDLEWRYEHEGAITGVTSGFASVDELTMGWQAGDLIVIAARPSIGKTTLVQNMVRAAAGSGKRCGVFSLEMRRKQLEYRFLSSISGVDLTRIMKGKGSLGAKDYPRISDALQVMSELPIEIDDRAGQSTHNIRSACRRLKAEGGLDLVVIDYVQLMPGTLERRGATRNEEVTEISRRMKDLAGELELPVIVLSQLTRGNEKEDRRPRLSDLRESGALEQDADIVAFLHRKHHRESGPTEFILEKQRNGPTGTVRLSIERSIVTFFDQGPEVEEPPAPEPPPEAKKPRQRTFARKWKKGEA